MIEGIFTVGEVDPEVARKSSYADFYDLKAYQRIESGQPDKTFTTKLLDIPDAPRLPIEANTLLWNIRETLNCEKVSRNYAYRVRVEVLTNEFFLYYATSHNYFARFDELVEQYKQLIKSLNDMLWDTLQYIKYKVEEARVEEIKNKVFQFYHKIPAKYLDVVVVENGNRILIYAPKQIIGRLIGKQGSMVNQLQQILGIKVSILDSPILTDLYTQEHPEIPKDPETLKLVSEAIKLLSELEKRGITIQQLLNLKKTLEGEDEYE
jgi:transcription antitermination factor NusA-like protein